MKQYCCNVEEIDFILKNDKKCYIALSDWKSFVTKIKLEQVYQQYWIHSIQSGPISEYPHVVQYSS